MSDAAIIIFQKTPELGKVKTRLAKTIGEAKALEAYRLLLQHTHEQVALVEADVLFILKRKLIQVLSKTTAMPLYYKVKETWVKR